MLNPSPKGCLVTQHIIDQLTTIRRRKISIRGSLLSRFISYLLYIFLCWGQNHQIIVFIPIHLAQSPAIFYTREWIHHKKNMDVRYQTRHAPHVAASFFAQQMLTNLEALITHPLRAEQSRQGIASLSSLKPITPHFAALDSVQKMGAEKYYQQPALAPMDVALEQGNGGSKCRDEDGRLKRTGTLWTASAHIVTAVIGSGVLSLAWAIGQLGWVAGPIVMLLFSIVTYYTSTLLADCYRTGDPTTGKRNYSYMDAVHAYLGGVKVKLCGFIQYANLFGVAVGYTIASSISMMAIRRSNCFHEKGHENPCHASSTPYMIIFGILEIFLSQIPDFDQIWWLSIVAAVMSFTYSSIGLSLGIVQVVANRGFKGSLTGVSVGAISPMTKVWHSLQAFGDIAFAYSFSLVLIEIQDTVKAPPPSEAKVMKKASFVSIVTTTLFYMLCGCMGYAAFGDEAPSNLLTGFGFYNPFWLLDVANAAIVIHLVGAYQVFCQPLFAFIEKWASATWPESGFVTREISLPLGYRLSLFRLVWRSAFVVLTTVISMLMPFFNDVVGLLGALGFWPLTVYFPVEMYIVQKRIPRWSTRWVCLQMLSLACLAITVAAAIGSVAGIVTDLQVYQPFKNDS